jgi:lysophospholipase L1-like esterase
MPKLICFGDSHTARERNPDGSPRLTSALRMRFPEWEVLNAGVSGHTTRDALGRLEEDVILHDPDLVVVFFGSNDAGHHRDVPPEEYGRNLRQILRRIGPGKCLVAGVLPVDEEKQRPKRDNATLRGYGQVAVKVAKEEGADWLDLFEEALKTDFRRLLKEDGLHLNPAGDRWLSAVIGDKLEEIMKAKGFQAGVLGEERG